MVSDLWATNRFIDVIARDRLAGLIGNGFSKKDGVYFHRRLSICDYIEVDLSSNGCNRKFGARDGYIYYIHKSEYVAIIYSGL
jgi:hypothetical protein